MILGLLAFGSVGFWALVVTIFLLNFYFVELERTFWATVTLIGTFVALAFLGDFNLWHVVRDNPIQAVIAGASYFGIGAVWSIGKWWFYVKEMFGHYTEARNDFMISEGKNPSDAMDQPTKGKWAMNSQARAYAKPLIRRHKSQISMWMIYWPWSGVWTLINDPVKKIFARIFHELQGLYQKIADSVYKGAERDSV